MSTEPTTDAGQRAGDPADPVESTEPKAIDITPRSWSEVAPILLMLLVHGDAKGTRYAEQELLRMAQIADLARTAVQALSSDDDTSDAGTTPGAAPAPDANQDATTPQ